MKIAKNMKEIEIHNLPDEIRRNEYIRKFQNEMMNLSNRLNEIDTENEFSDDYDIKEDYLPAIQEFIFNIEGG